MFPIIPRDATFRNLSDYDLLSLLSDTPPILRTKAIHELSFRRNKSQELKNAFWSAISNENNRKEFFFGFIKVAWIPVIDVLDSGVKNEIEKLKQFLIKEWPLAERKYFYEYVKNDFEVFDILSPEEK